MYEELATYLKVENSHNFKDAYSELTVSLEISCIDVWISKVWRFH
jgi:hypothetical protein